MHVLRFSLCGNQGLKERQLNRAHCQLNNYCNEWSVMVSDNYCLSWKLFNTGQLDRIRTDIYKN